MKNRTDGRRTFRQALRYHYGKLCRWEFSPPRDHVEEQELLAIIYFFFVMIGLGVFLVVFVFIIVPSWVNAFLDPEIPLDRPELPHYETQPSTPSQSSMRQ